MDTGTILSLILSTGITSSFLQPVVQKLANLLESKIGRTLDTDNKLRKLERTLLQIQSLVSEVEGRPNVSNSGRLLIEDFKGVLLDSDDLLNKIHLQLLNEGETNPNKLQSIIKEEVTRMYEDVHNLFKEMEMYFFSEISKPRPPQLAYSHVSSLIDPSCVIGLKIKKEEVIKLLTDDAWKEDNVDSMISIVGMGGTGKTTLAQLVYNDEALEDRFKLRMWVCVSLVHDLFQVTKLILESATKKVCKLSNFDDITMQLKEVIVEKEILLVLDDMWNESPSDWESLKFLFRFAAPGSRIMVTTRSRTVSSIAASSCDACIFSPPTLSEEDCWGIIKNRVKAEVDHREDLKVIGLQLAEKCKGIPLAAKVIGDSLHLKFKEVEWEALLKCDLWDLPEDKNQVYQKLKLSYDHLPAYLKRCFAYCSIIPQGKKVRVKDLIQMWVAEGFIQAQGKVRPEDIGRKYLDELCSRSLFQISSNDEVEMHDFIHDLAKLVSTNLCLHLEDNKSTNSVTFLSQNVRHLSLVFHNNQPDEFAAKLEESYRYQKLRTFMLFENGIQLSHSFFELQIFASFFEKFEWLRVLNMSGSGIRKVSNNICRFKHLHYLGLSKTRIMKLPPHVVNLCWLETLQLEGCQDLKVWPDKFEKLVKLRHLHFSIQGQVRSMPQNLGKLTTLETLPMFTVGSEEGYQIGELENLNCLSGSIYVKDLQNVENFQKAESAKLHMKKYLDKLELHWSAGNPIAQTVQLHEEVLKGLEPHARLKVLKVKGYLGRGLPDWIYQLPTVNVPTRQLERLVLRSCSEFASLASIHHLTSLTKLEIHDCPNLTSLPAGGLPSSLKSLIISQSGISKLQCEEGGDQRDNVKSISYVEVDKEHIPTP